MWDNITVTIFVKDEHLQALLKILAELDEEENLVNDVKFDARSVSWGTWSDVISHPTSINVPVELYLKFRYKYTQQLKRRTKELKK